MHAQPNQRLDIVSDLNTLLLNGLSESVYIVLLDVYMFFVHSLKVEILLNSRSELLACMISNGLFQVIGDIIANETDGLVLVCTVYYICPIDCIVDCDIETKN